MFPSRLSFRIETWASQSITHVNKKGSKIALEPMTKQNISQIASYLLYLLCQCKIKNHRECKVPENQVNHRFSSLEKMQVLNALKKNVSFYRTLKHKCCTCFLASQIPNSTPMSLKILNSGIQKPILQHLIWQQPPPLRSALLLCQGWLLKIPVAFYLHF